MIGQVEVDSGRIVWETIGRPSVEHVAELWRSGGCSVCKRLESSQIKMGRRLLGTICNTVAELACKDIKKIHISKDAR